LNQDSRLTERTRTHIVQYTFVYSYRLRVESTNEKNDKRENEKYGIELN